MKYKIEKNKIIVEDLSQFNIKQILECGQIFRFEIAENIAKVYSLDKLAVINTYGDRVEIETEDVEYFINFFDLSTDYNQIKTELKKDKFLSKAIDYGYGIRILKNNFFEMLVSFIISANNNIARIKKSIQFLCEKFGQYNGKYFSFPTLTKLKKATVQDYKSAGLGYRAEQMYETIQNLTNSQIEEIKTKSTEEQFKFLISLKGVGEKVANCVMLFGLGKTNSFPVDTWINKVYNKLTNTKLMDRKKITKELSERYGNLSGYAQQYFFYYFRENKIT